MAPAQGARRASHASEMIGHIGAAYVCVLFMAQCFVAGFASWAAAMTAFEAAWGRTRLVFMTTSVVATVGFWGFGALFSLPALLGVRRGKIQPGKDLDVSALLRALPLIAFNFVVSLPIFVAACMGSLPEASFDLRTPPAFFLLARDAAVWLICQEIANYYLHRWMHVDKRLYGAIHKLHHSWTASTAYTALYCHPIEHLLVNLLPLFVGPLLCGSHITAIAGWFFMGLIATNSVHSGYWVTIDHGAHDDHHAKFDVNYGILGVLDCLHGTNQLPAARASGTPVCPLQPSGSIASSGAVGQ